MQEFARLEKLHRIAFYSLRGLLTEFRAAFPPPCRVGDADQNSIHEGVVDLAGRQLLHAIMREIEYQRWPPPPGLSEHIFAPHPWESTPVQYWRRHPRNPKPVDRDELRFRNHLATKLPAIRQFFRSFDVDLPTLLVALNKEHAKVATMVNHEVQPERWTQPKRVKEWAAQWGLSENTMRTRLKEMSECGEAIREGKFWRLREWKVPVTDPSDEEIGF